MTPTGAVRVQRVRWAGQHGTTTPDSGDLDLGYPATVVTPAQVSRVVWPQAMPVGEPHRTLTTSASAVQQPVQRSRAVPVTPPPSDPPRPVARPTVRPVDTGPQAVPATRPETPVPPTPVRVRQTRNSGDPFPRAKRSGRTWYRPWRGRALPARLPAWTVVGALAVAGAGLAGTIGVRQFASARPAPRPAASPPTPSSAPPVVTLTDHGGSVVLTWRLNGDAPLQYAVLAGPPGTEPVLRRAVAGTATSMVLSDLDRTAPLCFQVVAVYRSALSRSEPVCRSR